MTAVVMVVRWQWEGPTYCRTEVLPATLMTRTCLEPKQCPELVRCLLAERFPYTVVLIQLQYKRATCTHVMAADMTGTW